MKNIIFILVFVILNINIVYGTIYTETVLNGCVYSTSLNALFEPNVHVCSNGYYLPANHDDCTICPSGATCSGGTYDFNENSSRGITYPQQITSNIVYGCDMTLTPVHVALFEPNIHTCTPGYYMPANYDGCVICPVDSYCGGGAYTFNETVAQGIVSCGAGLFAPMGMSSSNQCGRILHIGENMVYLHSTKKTTPALHVDIDQDGTADYFGNMTTLDVPMTHGTDKKLKLQYDGVTYSVYDDSVDLSEYTN